MKWLQLFALLISTAVVSSSIVEPVTTTVKPIGYDVTQDGSSSLDLEPGIVIDGIPLDNLSLEEIKLLLEDKDSQLVVEFDLIALKKLSDARVSDVTAGQPGLRKKRVAPLIGIAARLAFTGARALFRGASRSGLSRSGTRVTQQYNKSGGFSNAMRDFNRLGVQNQKSFSSGSISGRTGTVGRHRVTVRDGSSSGRPTLEIRSPRGGGSSVRKFRYNQN